jgi:hypothetical protein
MKNNNRIKYLNTLQERKSIYLKRDFPKAPVALCRDMFAPYGEPRKKERG